jgi:hypothetical protein
MLGGSKGNNTMSFQLTMILFALAYLVPVLLFEVRNDYRNRRSLKTDEIDHNFDGMWEAANHPTH